MNINPNGFAANAFVTLTIISPSKSDLPENTTLLVITADKAGVCTATMMQLSEGVVKKLTGNSIFHLAFALKKEWNITIGFADALSFAADHFFAVREDSPTQLFINSTFEYYFTDDESKSLAFLLEANALSNSYDVNSPSALHNQQNFAFQTLSMAILFGFIEHYDSKPTDELGFNMKQNILTAQRLATEIWGSPNNTSLKMD